MEQPKPELYEKLTKKEQIIELAKKGYTRKAIAQELNTYYNYVTDVLRGMK